MIEIANLHKTYNIGKQNAFHALKDVSINIPDGEMTAIIGKSGAGKSTLMHILGCIDNFEQGKYILNGQDVSSFGEKKRAIVRNCEIGIVLQDFALVDNYSVIENVMIPLFFSQKRVKGYDKKKRAMNVLEMLGIGELANKQVNKLSGGQKQRAAIARAMVNNPGILLADEPTGALDVKTSEEIMEVFTKLNEAGTTVIIITHDMDVASKCQRVIEIRDGEIAV